MLLTEILFPTTSDFRCISKKAIWTVEYGLLVGNYEQEQSVRSMSKRRVNDAGTYLRSRDTGTIYCHRKVHRRGRIRRWGLEEILQRLGSWIFKLQFRGLFDF